MVLYAVIIQQNPDFYKRKLEVAPNFLQKEEKSKGFPKKVKKYSTNFKFCIVKYYLLSLDENGSFKCKSGGQEIVKEYLDESGTGPTVAIDYSLADYSGSAYMHIHDIFD